jgi:hypothetical protein
VTDYDGTYTMWMNRSASPNDTLCDAEPPMELTNDKPSIIGGAVAGAPPEALVRRIGRSVDDRKAGARPVGASQL